MWHNLETVAEHRRLKVEPFVEFALKNHKAYAIVDNQVNTWHVDKLVADFKEQYESVNRR